MSKVITEKALLELLQRADSQRISGEELLSNFSAEDRVHIEYLSSEGNPCDITLGLWLSQLRHSCDWVLQRMKK